MNIIEAIRETTESIRDWANGKFIASPVSAKVGQALVVQGVDENGKPTEWETADMVSGGQKTHLEKIVDYTFDGTTTVATSEGLTEYILYNGQKAVWNKDNSGNLLKARRVWGYVHCTQAVTQEAAFGKFTLWACAVKQRYADVPSNWWYGDDVGNGAGTYKLNDDQILNNTTINANRATSGWADHDMLAGAVFDTSNNPAWLARAQNGHPHYIALEAVNGNYKDYIYAATLCVAYPDNIVPAGVRIVVVAEVIDE